MSTSSPTGFEVERESSERSLENLAKAEYVASMQALDTAKETLARVAAFEPEARAEAERLLVAAHSRAENVPASAREQGKQEGREEGKKEVANELARANALAAEAE